MWRAPHPKCNFTVVSLLHANRPDKGSLRFAYGTNPQPDASRRPRSLLRYLAGNAHGDAEWWYVIGNDGAGPNDGAPSDPHARQQLHSHPDPHIILKLHRLKFGSLISHRNVKIAMAVIYAGNKRPAADHAMIAYRQPSPGLVNLAARPERNLFAGGHLPLIDADHTARIEDILLAKYERP